LNSHERYLERASQRYHRALLNPEDPGELLGVKDYLTEHAIFSAAIIAAYRLGAVVRPMPGDERFAGMMAIPYLTRNGVKALKFRNLGGHPKYAQRTGQSVRLYNTAAYFAADGVIGIAEGEVDAIVATERLGIPTIGVPGAEMWKAHRDIWLPAFRNFQRVLMFTDGDAINEKTGLRPGEELGKAVAESLGWRVRIIDCPEGEDVSSMVAAGRGDELKAKFAEDDDEDDDEKVAA